MELTRPYDESLKTKFLVEYVKPIEKVVRPPGKKSKREERFDVPKAHSVYKKDWGDKGWSGEDVVEVGEMSKNGKNIIDVWINMDANDLVNFLRAKPNISPGKQDAIKKYYKLGIHLYSLMLLEQLKERQNRFDLIPEIMKGISKILLSLGDAAILKALED